MTQASLRHLARQAMRPVALQHHALHHRFRAAGLRPHQVDVGGGQLHLWTGGRGPPLLLIHGFGASALWQWSRQVQALAAQHTLLVPDLPGFGDSRFPMHAHTLHHQVEVMLALMARYTHQPCDVVGISYGGFVALRLQEVAPQKLRRLVVMSCPGRLYNETDYQALLRRYDIAHITELLLPAHPQDVRRLFSLAWSRPPWVPSWALHSIHQDLFQHQVAEKRALLTDLVGHLQRPPPPPQAHHPTPSMVIWGEQDRLFPPALGQRLATHLHAALHLLPKTAHAPNLERPRRVNRLLRRFLQHS